MVRQNRRSPAKKPYFSFLVLGLLLFSYSSMRKTMNYEFMMTGSDYCQTIMFESGTNLVSLMRTKLTGRVVNFELVGVESYPCIRSMVVFLDHLVLVQINR